mgnify:FL=1
MADPVATVYGPNYVTGVSAWLVLPVKIVVKLVLRQRIAALLDTGAETEQSAIGRVQLLLRVV